MGIWRSMAGMLKVELTSADPAGTLLAMQNEGIVISDVEKIGDLTLCFWIGRRDGKRLVILANKRGETLTVIERQGIFFTLQVLLKRPVLVVGMIMLLAFSCWVPSRVFFVQVEGNSSIPAMQIVEQAQLCGIGFGASRREVRSERMKNALLAAMPQLQWAGVNTYGCTAVITVRERQEQQKDPQPYSVSSIVAVRDGVIREMTVLRGNGLCRPGQAVKAGQVLVSGYTDVGLSIQATRAEAEIFAQTQRELTVLSPAISDSRGKITSTEKKYSLIIGKKRINFYNSSGISGGSCAKIYTEKYLTLPGGFTLPIAIVTEEWISYETESSVWDGTEKCLQDFSKKYLQQQMLLGKIEQADEILTALDGVCRLDGIYGCYEMIGITRTEENLTEYDKSD